MVAEFNSFTDNELESIHQHFEFRAQLLARLSKDKNHQSIQPLLDHEAIVKVAILGLIRQAASLDDRDNIATQPKKSNVSVNLINIANGQSQPFSNASCSERVVVTDITRPTKLRPRAKRHTAVVTNNNESLNDLQQIYARIIPTCLRVAVPGLEILILYCVAHLSLYELLYAIIMEVTKKLVRQDLFYAILLASSLCGTFLTGAALSWISEEGYEDIKSCPCFTMRWFKRRPVVKSTVDLCCLYFCFISVAHIQNQCLGFFDIRKDLLDSLPSMRRKTTNMPSYSMALRIDPASIPTGMGGSSRWKENICWGNVTSSTTSVDVPIDIMEDSAYLWSKLSAASYYAVMGNLEGPIVNATSTMTYYGICTSVSIYLLWKLGYHFWMR